MMRTVSQDEEELRLPLCSQNQFSVVSFNTLVRWYYHWHSHTPEEWRSWDHRHRLLRRLLPAFNASVLCLQEVNHPTFEEDFGFLRRRHGYRAVLQRPAGRRFTMVCATFFDPAAFALEWEDHRSRALLLGLRHRATGRPVVVVNAHLKGGPGREAARDRLAQLRSALRRAARRFANPPERYRAGVVVAGDFNCGAAEPPHAFLRGEEGEDGAAAAAAGAAALFGPLRDAHAGVPGHASYWAKGGGPGVIDFVYHSAALAASCFLDALPGNRRAAVALTQLPNGFNPSDHLPVGCVLGFSDGGGGGGSGGGGGQQL